MAYYKALFCLHLEGIVENIYLADKAMCDADLSLDLLKPILTYLIIVSASLREHEEGIFVSTVVSILVAY